MPIGSVATSGAPVAADDVLDLGDCRQRALDAPVGRDRLGQRDAGQAPRLDQQVALVELRDELGAEPGEAAPPPSASDDQADAERERTAAQHARAAAGA